jgi:hypothetical protein
MFEDQQTRSGKKNALKRTLVQEAQIRKKF